MQVLVVMMLFLRGVTHDLNISIRLVLDKTDSASRVSIELLSHCHVAHYLFLLFQNLLRKYPSAPDSFAEIKIYH